MVIVTGVKSKQILGSTTEFTRLKEAMDFIK